MEDPRQNDPRPSSRVRASRRGGQERGGAAGVLRGRRWRVVLRSLRPHVVVLAVYGVVAGICTQVPLLDVLGYESAFVLALFASAASTHLTVVLVHRWRRAVRDPLDTPLSPLAGVLGLYGRALAANLLLLLLPLDILSANAAFVRNCAYWVGLAWFVTLPVASAAVGTAWGVALGLLPVRRRIAVLGAYAVVLGGLGWGVVRFYRNPPVCLYGAFFGYFTGNLYDADVAFTLPLGMARLTHLVGAGVVLLAAALLFSPGRRHLVLRPGDSRGRLWVASAVGAAIWVTLWWAGGRLAFRVDRQDLVRELGGVVRTPHFVLVYSRNGSAAGEIRWHAADLEFHHAELARFFGMAPRNRITVFLFRDDAQKRRWYGAAQVDMAKPWRQEAFLTERPFPHPVLRHELAHLFAATFGDRVFGVSLRWRWLGGVLPVPAFNPGLIEGAAVAAAWQARGGLTPHQWAAAMVRLGKAPPLAAVMGYGFFGSAAARSYAVAGSFCRFLVERFGAARFRRLYRSGGDFEGVYGRSLPMLERAWQGALSAVPLGRRELDLARERFRGRPVYARPCLHEVARLERRAGALAARGDPEGALRLYGRICRYDPGDPAHLLGRLQAALRAGDRRQAEASLAALLAHPAATPPLRAEGLRVVGNDAWRRGDRRRAAALFARASRLTVSEATARDLYVRRWALGHPRVGARLRPLLAPPPGAAPAPPELWTSLGAAFPREALVQYLVGSWYRLERRWLQAVARLRQALALGLPDPRFEREARFRLGSALLRAARFAQARRTYLGLDVPEQPAGVRLRARRQAARAAFFGRFALRLGLASPRGAAPPIRITGDSRHGIEAQ